MHTMSTSKGRTTRAAAERPAGGVAAMRRPPTHPGEVFREDFRLAQQPPISQAEAARRVGWSTNRMNEFEVGKRGVTPENATSLQALTGASAEFWLTLQMHHDLWHATQKMKPIKPDGRYWQTGVGRLRRTSN
jgi:antitoxin HigA-1